MAQNSKMSLIVSVIIIAVVVAVLIFITINKKKQSDTQSLGSASDTTTMDNTASMQDAQGVKYTVTKEGSGQTAKTGDTVTMNYTGRLDDGTVFDSNVDPKFQHVQPFTFTLGSGEVIPGWDKGIVGMKVGEKRTLVISPDDAYGATGAGNVIPPNATLTFDVELVSIDSSAMGGTDSGK